MRIVRNCLIVTGCAAALASATIGEFQYQMHYDGEISNGRHVVWNAVSGVGADTLWHFLAENVFVDSGCTLTIRPGTWIFAGGGTGGDGGEPAGALIVARGGVLFAEGTVDSPIVFTAKGDEPRDPFDLGPGAKGMWGGVAILGRAQIQNPAPPGHQYAGMHVLEGIPAEDPRSWYGRADSSRNNESSGRLRYVSIRHGGSTRVSNEELNGLTLGGVGRGTVLQFIEVYATSDDGFEMFGGVPQLKYCVTSFQGDDGFDWDEGYRGKGQFWFSLEQDYEGDNGGEFDGQANDYPTKARPISMPRIYNATFIGPGRTAPCQVRGMRFRDSTGGFFYNTIVTGFGRQAIFSDTGSTAPQPWGAERDFRNSIIWDCGNNTPGGMIFPRPDTAILLHSSRKNRIINPGILSVSRTMRAPFLDPRVCDTSVALDTNFAVKPPWDGFLSTATAHFIGAFAPPSKLGANGSGGAPTLWLARWTALDETRVLMANLYTQPREQLCNWTAQWVWMMRDKKWVHRVVCRVDGADSSHLFNPVSSKLFAYTDTCGYRFFKSQLSLPGKPDMSRWGKPGEQRMFVFALIDTVKRDTLRDTVIARMR